MWHEASSPFERDWLAGCFGVDAKALGAWLGFWASVHDVGKATPAFQVKAQRAAPWLCDRVQQAGLALCDPLPNVRHDVLGRAVLKRQVTVGSFFPGLQQALLNDLATITTGHHGVFPLAYQTQNLARHLGNEVWMCEQDALTGDLATCWRIASLPPLRTPQPEEQAALMVMAGLISVADWIASCEEYFPYAGPEVDVEKYLSGLRARAGAALARAGWRARPDLSGREAFGEVFPFPPNEMQRLALEAGRSLETPGLVIIEAPMGQGKTEAAFALAQGFLRRFGHGGAYLALPTQATSNQMLTRFGEFLVQTVCDGPVNLRLLHGQAMLHAAYPTLRGIAQDDQSAAGEVTAEEWFAASKRGLLAPFAVGTVDQGLLAILQTRHGFVRLFGLSGKVIILDEVHAYDTYTSELLQHLLRWLGRMNCSVVLLSATLPGHKQCELASAYCGREVPLPAVPYPRITVADGGTARAVPVPSETPAVIRLSAVPGDLNDLVQRLGDALASGGCAACICNTVGRAQELFLAVRAALASEGCEVRLLHSRFPAGRRACIEQEVVQRFGKEGWQGERPTKAVLVATQVVEQSLDLDFDLMVTDLAPVDLVLQRSGRLHRHQKVADRPTVRPARLREPQLWLVTPETSPDGLPRLGPSAYVYEPYLLLRSYLCLVASGREVITVPGDMEEMIEQVYGNRPLPVPSDAWQKALDASKTELERSTRLAEWHAYARTIPDPDDPDSVLSAFNQQLPEDEALATQLSLGGLTRKAAVSVRVICLHQVHGRVCLDADGQRPAVLDRPPSREELLELLNQSVSLTHFAVVKHFLDGAAQQPAGWRKAPLLRHSHPLVFQDGIAMLGGRWAVALDTELGIVIRDATLIAKED